MSRPESAGERATPGRFCSDRRASPLVPGDARDLTLVEGEGRHLARRLRAADLDLLHLVRRAARRLAVLRCLGWRQAIDGVYLLAGQHRLVGLVRGHPRGGHRHVVGPCFRAVDAPRAVGPGVAVRSRPAASRTTTWRPRWGRSPQSDHATRQHARRRREAVEEADTCRDRLAVAASPARTRTSAPRRPPPRRSHDLRRPRRPRWVTAPVASMVSVRTTCAGARKPSSSACLG